MLYPWLILNSGGGTQRLTRLIGIDKAKELIYTGATLKSEEAKAYGK
jgi:enoyl-CoA hydratase/carnithine racemase